MLKHKLNVRNGRDRSLQIIILFLFMFLISCTNRNTRFNEIKSQEYYASLVNETILPGTKLPLDESAFRGACWAMEITQYRNELMLNRMKAIYEYLPQYDLSTQRSYWEAINALYPNEFEIEAYNYLIESDQPKLFAMCAYYLIKNANTQGLVDNIEYYLTHNFTLSQRLGDPILIMLQHTLEGKPQRPPVSDILKHNLHAYPTIYVLLRENRDYPGLAIIKDGNGNWIKNGKELLHTRILGRSLSNLPGTITNGNTPQGVFTIMGVSTSDNVFIGPSKTIWTALPFEVFQEDYFHGEKESPGSMGDYAELLPKSWHAYPWIYEAYFAGLAGRSEIIVHGSTIWPELYKNKAYYPLTPSLGCMTHYEKWSNKGRLIKSDQEKLVDALMSCSTQQGYLVVVEIDDEKRDVTINDINDIIYDRR